MSERCTVRYSVAIPCARACARAYDAATLYRRRGKREEGRGQRVEGIDKGIWSPLHASLQSVERAGGVTLHA